MNGFLRMVVLASLTSGSIVAMAEPSVTSASLRQDWPWSTATRLEYELSGVTDPVDISVTFRSGGVEIPCRSAGLKGDVYGIASNGRHAIEIDPVRAFGHVGSIDRLSAEVTCSPQSVYSKETLYKIVDLKTGEMSDVTRGALLNGDYGPVETDFGAIGPGFNTTLTNVCIWTGITNNLAKYAGTHMVFRRIPAGTFNFCVDPSKTNAVTISKDYYIGVFKITYAQMATLGIYSYVDYPSWGANWICRWVPFGSHSTCYKATDGLTRTSLNDDGKSRGTNTVDIAYQTTSSESWVIPRIMYRVKTGPSATLLPLNPPSQARWHRAMRGGTDSYYYDGLPAPANTEENEQMNRLGFYRANGGVTDNGDGTSTTNGPCTVGRFLPNAFGLYDMLGNLREIAADNLATELKGTDPWGGHADDYANGTPYIGTDYQRSAMIRPYQDPTNGQIGNNNGNNYSGNGRWGVRLSFTADEVVTVSEYEKSKQIAE